MDEAFNAESRQLQHAGGGMNPARWILSSAFFGSVSSQLSQLSGISAQMVDDNSTISSAGSYISAQHVHDWDLDSTDSVASRMADGNLTVQTVPYPTNTFGSPAQGHPCVLQTTPYPEQMERVEMSPVGKIAPGRKVVRGPPKKSRSNLDHLLTLYAPPGEETKTNEPEGETEESLPYKAETTMELKDTAQPEYTAIDITENPYYQGECDNATCFKRHPKLFAVTGAIMIFFVTLSTIYTFGFMLKMLPILLVVFIQASPNAAVMVMYAIELLALAFCIWKAVKWCKNSRRLL